MTLPVPVRHVLSVLGLASVAALVSTVATSEPLATGQIQEAGGVTAIKDSYIVGLRDGPAATKTARSLAGRYGATISHTYDDASGFEAIMPERMARRLAADPRVSFVEQNHTVLLTGTQTNPPSWGLDRIDERSLPRNGSFTFPDAEAVVHVYVIDTGIRTSHVTFGDRASSAFDTVNGGAANDCNGHGTHVAGTIGGAQFGVAKSVRLHAVRVLGCDGGGSVSRVIAGVNWVARNAVKPAVANLSLGGRRSSALDAAVNRAINSGVTFVVAAGNEDANACSSSPARVPAAITVGATGRSDRRASFSNFGPCVDIFAPGVDITSAGRASNTATMTASGTSMAAPHVAGAAALILTRNPGFSPAQVHERLVADATTDRVVAAGTGSANRLLFIRP
jgi:subtilisin family serine protease